MFYTSIIVRAMTTSLFVVVKKKGKEYHIYTCLYKRKKKHFGGYDGTKKRSGKLICKQPTKDLST